MKKKKKKRLLFIGIIPILVILLLLLISYILSPQPVNAMMVGFSGMTKYDNHIYMEKNIPKETKAELINDYAKSKTKILEFFNDLTAKPTIIFVQSQKAIHRYAENPTGQTYYMYWGNYIVIGPNGFNEDVIAHELMHSELRERLNNKHQVPVWFDEGLATLVDDRYSAKDNYKTDSGALERLENKGAFYDPLNSRENYQTAKDEVHRWYGINGKTGLKQLINGLNKGIPFDKLYYENLSR